METQNTNEYVDVQKQQSEKKKNSLNKLTTKANLNFNVNTFKSWMKDKLTNDCKFFDVVRKNGTTEKALPKLRGSHVSIAAMNEKLCFVILDEVTKRLSKNKNGLYTIGYNDLADTISVNSELRRNLHAHLDVYDSTLNYKDQYCIKEKIIKKYIDTVFSECIDITNDAFNLLVFLLLKTSVRILDTSYIMMIYAKTHSLSPNTVMNAVDIHFSGTMKNVLKMKIDEAVKLCGKDLKEDEPAEESEPQTGNEDK